MKVCPVCNSKCFDDMEVCFGCLHRFTEDDAVDVAVGASCQNESPGEAWESAERKHPSVVRGERPARRSARSSMVVPAVSVCNDPSVLTRSEGEGDGSCEPRDGFMVLKIEIPQTCRGISVSYA